MKKCIFCLGLILFISISGYSQSVDQLLKNASRTENIEKIKVSGFMMSLGKMMGGVGDIPVAKGIKSLEMFTLSDASPALKKDFITLFSDTKDKGEYETLIFVKEKEGGIRILVKKEKDIVKDIVFLCMDKEEPTIIKFSGKIKEKDIEKLVSKYNQ